MINCLVGIFGKCKNNVRNQENLGLGSDVIVKLLVLFNYCIIAFIIWTKKGKTHQQYLFLQHWFKVLLDFLFLLGYQQTKHIPTKD